MRDWHRRWPGLAALALALAMGVGGAVAAHAAPRVVQVQPSAREVPANLLRISIRFSAPVDGPVLPRIGLRRADGEVIREPFLPQALWSPDGITLTFLMHPGRVKTGLDAREALGPILAAGEEVTLTLDGRPLRRWRVAGEDRAAPRPSAWTLSRVRAASGTPLVVRLDGPIDGRDADDLAIADARGRRVEGRARLTEGESVWIFTPASPWRRGTHRLRVRETLEDPAGNRVGRPFESPLASPADAPAADAAIAFEVR